MSLTSRSLLHNLAPVVAGLAVVLAPAPCRAAPKPLTPEEQAKVDRAIAKGIEYLKNTQRKDGTWPATDGPLPRGFQNDAPLGYTLVAALALLESGVPADDPCVQKAADLLRRNLGKMKATYEVSLAVLFLDRLGDPKDEELVRDLGPAAGRLPGLQRRLGLQLPHPQQEEPRRPPARPPRAAQGRPPASRRGKRRRRRCRPPSSGWPSSSLPPSCCGPTSR